MTACDFLRTTVAVRFERLADDASVVPARGSVNLGSDYWYSGFPWRWSIHSNEAA